MMAQPTILFINSPTFAAKDMFRASINPPLNLAYLISSLSGSGLNIEVLDLGLECVLKYGFKKNNILLEQCLSGNPAKEYLSFFRKRIESTISARKYDLVAMNADLYPLAFYFLREAKQFDPKLRTIVGGTVASTSYGAFLDKKQIDFIVIDEGETTLRNLVLHLIKEKDLKDVKGIAYKRKGSYLRTPPSEPICLSRANMPNYSHFDMKSYLRLNGNRLMILSARGCRGNCKFCGMPKHLPIRIREPQNIVDEIKVLQEDYGINTFTFFNSMMNITPDYVNAFCAELLRRDLKIRFGCYLKADKYIDNETFNILKDAGCYAIDFGIESGSQNLLDKCDKGIKIEKAIRMVHLAKKAGLKVRCTFMWGLPRETWTDFFRTLKAYIKIRPDCSGFFELRVSESSEYHTNIEKYSSNYYEDAIRISFVRDRHVLKSKKFLAYVMQKIW